MILVRHLTATAVCLIAYAMHCAPAHAQEPPISCEAFIEKTIVCHPQSTEQINRQAILDDCVQSIALDLDIFAPLLACGLIAECDEFSACAAPAAESFKLKSLPRQIQRHAARGDLDSYKAVCHQALFGIGSFATPDVIAACESSADSIAAQIDALVASKTFSYSDFQWRCEEAFSSDAPTQAHPKLRAACKRFFSARADNFTLKLTAERDQDYSTDSTVTSLCNDLIDDLKRADRATDAAQILCDEARLAVQASQYFFIIQRALDAARAIPPTNPFAYGGPQACQLVQDLFSPLSVPFAQAKVDAIQALCADWVEAMATIIAHGRDHDPTAYLGNKHHCDIYVKAAIATHGPTAEKAAQTLCDERALAAAVSRSVTSIDKAIIERNGNVYVNCTHHITKIDALATPFAQSLRDVVLQKCFIDFNKFILSVHLSEATTDHCPQRVRSSLKEVSLYALDGRDPDLDNLISQARALSDCNRP